MDVSSSHADRKGGQGREDCGEGVGQGGEKVGWVGEHLYRRDTTSEGVGGGDVLTAASGRILHAF